VKGATLGTVRSNRCVAQLGPFFDGDRRESATRPRAPWKTALSKIITPPRTEGPAQTSVCEIYQRRQARDTRLSLQ
jgi:hypothetical protein